MLMTTTARLETGTVRGGSPIFPPRRPSHSNHFIKRRLGESTPAYDEEKKVVRVHIKCAETECPGGETSAVQSRTITHQWLGCRTAELPTVSEPKVEAPSHHRTL